MVRLNKLLARLNKPHCRLRTFADEILASCRGKSAQDMMDLISPTLRNIEAYCECSGMHCNGEKAKAMLCTLNNRLLTVFDISIWGAWSFVSGG